MKTLKVIIFSFFIIALLSTEATAQRLVQANEVTPQFLKETFENAYIEVEQVADTYIKVKDSYSVFVDIDPSKRYVTLSGVYQIVDGASKEKVLELMNKINGEVALIKIVYSEKANNIGYYYYFFIEGGFTQKSLVGALKLYKNALNLSLAKDTEMLIK
ncbi:hypothetical protein [Flavobacterium haoranii]|uniref:Sensory transduction regulator n=1 Tax=Flavobacterium haoranii TaxID=683124 RepID=A0A1M6IXY2_9FLAO|nr:hypothetical protein [Flavobacterium haoranii]SHJ39272.1 hypothetical protein SAMN05444337_1906 [Flavobacterium haoranii]